MAAQEEDYLGIKDYKVIGTRPIRHDGVDKVTGRACCTEKCCEAHMHMHVSNQLT
jgi:hypothetical protein